MRFFIAMYLICILLSLVGVVLRNRKYPTIMIRHWNKSWQHHLAVGGMIGSFVNGAIVLYLWGKGLVF